MTNQPKQKTAIRQLIEDLTDEVELLRNSVLSASYNTRIIVLNQVIEKAKAREPVNEQQIIDVYNDGYRAGDFEDADIYFNENFEKP